MDRYCCDAGQEIEYAVSRWSDINLEPRIVNRAKEVGEAPLYQTPPIRRFNPRKKISDRAPPLDSRLEPLDRIIVQESRYRNTHFAFQSVSFVSTFSYLYRASILSSSFCYNYYYYLLTMLKFQHFQLCHLNLYKSL